MSPRLPIRLLLLFLFVTSKVTFAYEKYSALSELKSYNFTGYVDTSYNYLLRNHQFISGVNDRVNDLTQNGFTLQQFAFTFSKQPSQGLGGLINVIAGRDAYSINLYGWNSYFGSQTLGLIAPAAYLQFAIHQFTFVAGLFNTLIGAEDYDPTKDTNFSRSILDGYAEPGTFMGIRSIYAPNTKLKVNVGLNNGWSGIRDMNRQVTVEFGGTYDFNTVFSLFAQGVSGEQRLLNKISYGPKGKRNLFNLIAIYHATKAMTFMVSGDYGSQSKALEANGVIGRTVWEGMAGYANYAINDQWSTALRGELYADRNGYTTGVKQTWQEMTLTLAYVPIKNLMVRAETRHDFSNVNAFLDTSGPGRSNNQQSYAVEALYKF